MIFRKLKFNFNRCKKIKINFLFYRMNIKHNITIPYRKIAKGEKKKKNKSVIKSKNYKIK